MFGANQQMRTFATLTPFIEQLKKVSLTVHHLHELGMRHLGRNVFAIKMFVGDTSRSVDLVTIPFLNKRIDARLQVDGKSTDTVATELRNTKTFIRRSAADKKLFRDGVKRLDEVSVEGKRNKGKPQLHS